MVYKNCFPNGCKKALTFSFDDGIEQDLHLQEIFRKNNSKCTFNLNSEIMGQRNCFLYKTVMVSRLTKEQVKDNYYDFEIASHGSVHPFLEKMSVEGIISDIITDRKNLEAIAKYPIRGFAYPYGTYNQTVIDTLKALGVKYARTIKDTHNYEIPTDFLQWHPTCHFEDEKIFDLISKFIESKEDTLELLYIWGHSYEIESDNKWDHIDKICSIFKHREDVWKATNMEIYNYLKALDQLEFTYDQTIVTNPTSLDLWISVDDKIKCIEKGKTLYIE